MQIKMKSPKLPALAFIVMVSCSALAQEAISASETLSAESPATSPAAISSMALPANRLIELLREKPELLIEVKKLAAERLQAQGIDVQENSITDEELVSKIATDSSLRSNLT